MNQSKKCSNCIYRSTEVTCWSTGNIEIAWRCGLLSKMEKGEYPKDTRPMWCPYNKAQDNIDIPLA